MTPVDCTFTNLSDVLNKKPKGNQELIIPDTSITSGPIKGPIRGPPPGPGAEVGAGLRTNGLQMISQIWKLFKDSWKVKLFVINLNIWGHRFCKNTLQRFDLPEFISLCFLCILILAEMIISISQEIEVKYLLHPAWARGSSLLFPQFGSIVGVAQFKCHESHFFHHCELNNSLSRFLNQSLIQHAPSYAALCDI